MMRDGILMIFQSINPHKLMGTAEIGNLLYDPQLPTIVKQKRVLRLIDTYGLPMKKIHKKWVIPYEQFVQWQKEKIK